MAKRINKQKKKNEEPEMIIRNVSPKMTESERIRVKREIEQKLYDIFKKYY